MKPVSTDVDFPALERDVLSAWEKDQVFRQQQERRQGAPTFSFYDGPPFANGLPHYGHLLANTIKDCVTRYWVMRGYSVDRRFGWDCHGLPVEFEIEKQKGLKGRPDILAMGVANFNETCRSSVMAYTREWRKTITRLGRWVDWNNQYRTMDRDFMESVWWVFAQLYRKGLVYRDFKVVPYSPRTTSVVSNFEANQNYKSVQDPSLTVKFRLAGEESFAISWTTTPWTLPSNLALAVGADIKYVRVRVLASGERWILAASRLEAYFSSPDEYAEEKRFPGSELIGTAYEPIFPFFKDHPRAFRVIAGDFVSTDEGTGIVQQAPAYGEDDFFACGREGIELVDPIDDTGQFTAVVPPYQGLYFKDADKPICRDLKAAGRVVRHETLEHTYPFDERTDTPLMYKAVPSWYVAVEKLVAPLVANNRQIHWVPGHLRDGRMGKWLENARDWAISRNRFWGTPLPIWICDRDEEHLRVFESGDELAQAAGREVPDLHLHSLADVTFGCGDCAGTMKPVDVVFDCWFESGSMPYAQVHYPFSGKKEAFEASFPADFIAEGLDQTRGWFYTLNVLSTALFDKPAFRNVIVNGTILDESGKKMSKRHRNYTPPDDLIERFGADSVRLYLLNSPLVRAEDLIFADKGVKDVVRAVLLPFWNAFSFLATYAQTDGWQPKAEHVEGTVHPHTDLDRWILSRQETLCREITGHMKDYKLYRVVPSLLTFLDELTNWYIRLSRRRFWGDSRGGEEALDGDRLGAYETLYGVLLRTTQLFAPFAPFLADDLYRRLTEGIAGCASSVHLNDYPAVEERWSEPAIERRMALMVQVIGLGRSLRQKHKIKTRQVLPAVTVIAETAATSSLEPAAALIRSELNVKEVLFSSDEGAHVRRTLQLDFRRVGQRLGKKLPAVRRELTALNDDEERLRVALGQVAAGGSVALLGEELAPADLTIQRHPKDDHLVASEGGVTVLLDTQLTEELVAEGYARELVNRIQGLRRRCGLEVSDRIALAIRGPQPLLQALQTHRSYVLAETLGREITVWSGDDRHDSEISWEECEIDRMKCTIGLNVTRDR